jgi:hypothetical protein
MNWCVSLSLSLNICKKKRKESWGGRKCTHACWYHSLNWCIWQLNHGYSVTHVCTGEYACPCHVYSVLASCMSEKSFTLIHVFLQIKQPYWLCLLKRSPPPPPPPPPFPSPLLLILLLLFLFYCTTTQHQSLASCR